MSARIIRVIGAAGLLVAFAASPVAAGGWATITADNSTIEPTEEEPFQFGFTVLQHGETPAGWESATLVLTNVDTGERISTHATPQGADGHFVATVTVPDAGYWTWVVDLRDLEVDMTPQAFRVTTATGTVPELGGQTLVNAIERVKAETQLELRTEMYTELETLRTEMQMLDARLNAVRAERDTLRSQVAAPTTTGGGLPIVGVVAIGALAGAIAGFAMLALGARAGAPRPVDEERAPAGAGTQPVA